MLSHRVNFKSHRRKPEIQNPKSKMLLAFALLLALRTVGASANTYNYTGATSPAQTWNRAIDNDTAQPTTVSGIGTQVPYSVFAFTVDTAGSYSIQSTASGWDNYAFLYANAFDATNALLNPSLGNDDYNFTGGQAGFTVTLNAGTPYYLVTTGFGNFDWGSFSNTISGPGQVAPVSLVVRVALDGVSNLSAAAVPLDAVRFTLRSPGSTTAIAAQNVVPVPVGGGSAYGICALTGLPAGTYDLGIKNPKNLQIVVPNITTPAIALLPDTLLSGGDANDDNMVDAADFGVLVNAYGGEFGASGSNYDARADFNYDGVVDVADFGLLINNYSSVGAP